MHHRHVLAAAIALLLMTMGAPAGPRLLDDAVKHEITAKDLKLKLDKGEKVIIIDARSSLNGQIIKGALHIPSDKLNDWAKEADKQAVIVTYCTCPHDEAAEGEVETLQGMGFKNALSLKGGLNAAREAGIPIVPPAAEQ